MQRIIVDIETNGPVAPLYSMISIGAVHHEDPNNTFYREVAPLHDTYVPEALAVSGFTHEQTMGFTEPAHAMGDFLQWLRGIEPKGRLLFVSDTTAFDFSFVNYYLWRYCDENPFGHAPLSLTNLYKGLTGDFRARIYHLRKTKHTHNALDDAMGNHEVLLAVEKYMRLRREVTKKSFITM
jgi:hypothetical protein